MVLEDVSMKVVILGNFDVSGRMVNPSFTKTGTWFDFFTGMELRVTDPDLEYYYRPGEFHIYTTEKIGGIKPGLVPWQGELITGIEEENRTLPAIYPNPTHGSLFIHSAGRKIDKLVIMDTTGKIFNLDNPKGLNDPIQISTESLPSGIYLLMISEKDSVTTWRFVKK
jgi:hypothetical protein